MDYQVKIDNFEGPMDLLLFFIQRDKLNIYDIPISHITKEFLDYMKMMDIMNIDLGGEFVYMATLLMKIKAKMLLPVSDDDEEQIEDPRTPLVQRLLEYQQYKKVSEDLREQYESHSVHIHGDRKWNMTSRMASFMNPSIISHCLHYHPFSRSLSIGSRM